MNKVCLAIKVCLASLLESLLGKPACLALSLASLLAGEASAQAPIVQGGAAPAPALVQREAHVHVGGPAPSLMGCGTGATVRGSDVGGAITLGSDFNTAGSCTLVFRGRWQSAYVLCIYQPISNNPQTPAIIVTNEGATVTQALFTVSTVTMLANVNYWCFGTQPQ